MNEIARLAVKFEADANEALKGIRSVEAEAQRMVSSLQGAGGQAGGVFDGIGVRAVAMGSLIASAVQAGASGLMQLGQSAAGAIADFEKMSAQFASMGAKEMVNLGQFKSFDEALGAATEKSKELLAWTQKLAIQSPFEEGDVSKALSVAQAFGFLATKYQTVEEAQKAGVISAQRLTQGMMNFAAATGKAGHDVQRLTLIAGQIKSIGKLMGGDSMQLKQAGINIEELIGKQMGKTTAEIIEMREKGAIPAQVALNALMTELESYGKAAELQGGSLGGLLASFSDLAKVSQRNLFGGVFDSLKPAMQQASAVLQDPAFQQGLKNLGAQAGQAVAVVLDWLGRLGSGAQQAMSAFQAGLSAAGVGGGVSNLLQMLGLDPNIANTAGAILNNIISVIQTGIAAVQAAIQGFQQGGLGGGVSAFLSALGLDPSVAAQALSVLNQVGAALQTGVAAVQAAVAGFASGGVAGGASALLQALGVDPTIVAQVTSIIGMAATAIQTGIGIVVGVVAGGAALIAQHWQTVLGALAGIGVAIAGFMAFQGVVGILTSVAGALAFLLSPVGLIIAAAALIGAAWVNNWGNIQGVVAQAVPILQTVASVVGGVLVGAFMAAGAVAGWIAANWGTISGVAATLAGIVGGVLVTAFNILGAVIGFVVQHWQVFAAVLGAVGAVLAGGAILGGITAIVTAFGTFMSILGGVGAVIASAGGLFGVLATLISLPMVPIALLAAAVGFLAVAWMTNMGNIQGGTNTYIAQIQASWDQLLGYIRAIVAFFQTPIDWTNPVASAQAVRQAWGKLKSDIGEVESEFRSRIAGIADASASGGSAAAQAAGQTADIVRDQYYRMPEDASVTTQLMKAVTEGNLAAIPGIVGGQMEVVRQVLGDKVAHWVEIVAQGAAKIKSELAAMQAAGQYVSEADMGGFADTGSAKQAEAIRNAPPSWSAPSFKAPDFGPVTAGLGAAGKGASGAGAAAKSAEDKIKEANAAITSTIETVNKLNEMLKSGLDGLTVGDSADQLVQLAGQIAALGRRFADAFAQAATGLTEDSYKGAQALGQGISASTSAINSMVGMLPKLVEFIHSDAWAEIQAAPGQVVAVAAQLIDIGKQIADVFVSAMGNVSEETAKSAQNGASVIGASSQALSALVGMLPKLWEFINLPEFDEMMGAQSQIVEAAGQIAQLGKGISDAFLSAMGTVDAETAATAQNASQVVGAATSSISSLIDTIGKIVAFLGDVDMAAVIANEDARAAVLNAASRLIDIGVAMTQSFIAAAGDISSKASLAAKRLGEGVKATTDAISGTLSLVQALLTFMGDAYNGWVMGSQTLRDWITGIGIQIMQMGLVMFTAFAQAGMTVGSVSVAASKRLAEGLQATTGGIGAVVQTLQALLTFMSDAYNGWVMGAASLRNWIVGIGIQVMQMGVTMLAAFVEAGRYLGSVQVASVKNLGEGIQAVTSAVGAAVDTFSKLIAFTEDASNRAAMESEDGRASLVWFGTALVQLGATILAALTPSVEFLGSQAVNATKLLGEGVGAVFGMLGSGLDTFGKLLTFTESAANRAALESDDSRAYLANLAVNLVNLGATMLTALIPALISLSRQVVNGAKLLGEGTGAVWSALGTGIDGLAKLFDFASNASLRAVAESDGARAWFAQLGVKLIRLGQALVDGFEQAGIVFSQSTVDSVSRFADALSSTHQALDDALGIVATFQDVLSSRFRLDRRGILDLAWSLFNLGRDLAVTFLVVANQFGAEVTPHARTFQEALGMTAGVLKDAWDAVSGLRDMLLQGGVKISLADASGLLDTLYLYADTLSRRLLDNANAYDGEVTPRADEFGRALALTSAVLGDALDVVTTLADAFKAGGVKLGIGDAIALFDDLLWYGGVLADWMLDLTNTYSGEVRPNANEFAKALALAAGVASDAWDAVAGLMEAFKAGGITITIGDAIALFDDLLWYGGVLASWFLDNANTYRGEVAPNAQNFADALSVTASVASDAWDLISGLQEAFKAGGVTISETDATRLLDNLLRLGQTLADLYLGIANVYAGEVKPAAGVFADALSVTSGATSDAWSFISDLQDALKAGGVTISESDAKKLLDSILRLGQTLADLYLGIANVYSGSVKDNARTFADALSVTNAATGDGIGLISDLQDFFKDGGVTISETDAKTLLSNILTLGRTLANDFLAIANVYDGSVKDAAQTFADALSVSNSATGDAIGLIAELQDFLEAKGITVSVDQLEALVTSLAKTGVRLANAFLAVANIYAGAVNDNAKNLAEALSTSNSAIGDAIGLVQELAEYKPGEWNIEDLVALVGELAYDARQLAERFVEAARNFDASGNVAAGDLADAIGSMASGIGDALDTLPGLIKVLPNYRSLSDSMLRQLDLLLDDIVKVVRAFGAKAKSIDWKSISTEAMSALSGGASDAWSAIGDTLDGIAKLMDPERLRLPSGDQLGAMVDQILPLIRTAVVKIASLSQDIPADEMKAATDNAAAVGAVFDALSTTVEAIQKATGLYVGSSGMNNLSEILRWVKDLFKQIVDAFNQGSDAAAAMTSMVNTLENIGGFAGTTIGTKLIDSLVAAIEAGSGRVATALAGILTAPTLEPKDGGGITPTASPQSSNKEAGGDTYNITLIQYVIQQIAADPTGTILQIRDAVT